MDIKISEIRITERIRKDNGDLQELAKSIEAHNLINPITLMEAEAGYVLIAGFRRLSAVKLLGWQLISATVLSPMDAEEQLRLEIEENESRKEFTKVERVVYAKKLKAIEKEKSRMRMSEHARDGYIQGWDGRPTPEEGKKESQKRRTRDELAKKVGFSSGKQLERAEYLFDNRPDLLEQVDEGKKTIYGAYEEAKRESKQSDEEPKISSAKELTSIGKINGKLGHTGEEFTRHNGFDYVVSEINSASAYFLREISMAAEHYIDNLRTPENNYEIAALLYNTIHAALEDLGIEFKEE